MYHEYQWRTSSKSFTEETRDKREIEANAFALAYCRLLSSRCNDSKMNGIRPLKNSDLMSMHYLMNMLKNLTYLKVTRLIKPGYTLIAM